MKAAILMLCHKNPDQILRLISALSHPQVDIFIHADIKMRNGDFCVLKEGSLSSNVHFASHRHNGELFDPSLVEIELALIKQAKKHGEEKNTPYQYYMLISGQDYPIRPIASVIDELDEIYPKPIIDCTPISKKNWVGKTFETNTSAMKYRRWIRGLRINSALRFLLKSSSYLFELIQTKIFLVTTNNRLLNEGIHPYGGSQWWILPDKAVNHVLGEVKENSKICNCLLNGVRSPDETFFQTLVMRSPTAYLVELNQPTQTSQNCKTYSHFIALGKPVTGHPHIITKDDYGIIANKSNYYFARKFDESVDKEILEIIDKKLLKLEV